MVGAALQESVHGVEGVAGKGSRELPLMMVLVYEFVD